MVNVCGKSEDSREADSGLPCTVCIVMVKVCGKSEDSRETDGGLPCTV